MLNSCYGTATVGSKTGLPVEKEEHHILDDLIYRD